MNRISPDEVLTTPAGELAALASESLFQLKNDAADLLAAAKAIVEHVDRAHRIAWELEHGKIPEGAIVRHRCDNPACCNPLHLSVGSHHENMQDAVDRGRMSCGVRHRLAKLNEDSVRVIRSSTASAATLARVFGVDRKTIWQVRSGQRWRTVL